MKFGPKLENFGWNFGKIISLLRNAVKTSKMNKNFWSSAVSALYHSTKGKIEKSSIFENRWNNKLPKFLHITRNPIQKSENFKVLYEGRKILTLDRLVNLSFFTSKDTTWEKSNLLPSTHLLENICQTLKEKRSDHALREKN